MYPARCINPRVLPRLAAALAYCCLANPLLLPCLAAAFLSLRHRFRKGLRLHDNPALLEACKDAKHVYPVFVLGEHLADPEGWLQGCILWIAGNTGVMRG